MSDCEVVIQEIQDEQNDKIKVRNKKFGRKSSEMWNYFTPLDQFIATCNICKLKFSYRTSTTNLRKHLVCKHLGGSMKDAEKLHLNDRKEENCHNERLTDYKEKENCSRYSPDESVSIKRQVNDTSSELAVSNSFFLRERGETDEYDAFAFTVAAKLRKMEERQRLYAERVINEALFKGLMDQLSPLSEIVICIPSSNSCS